MSERKVLNKYYPPDFDPSKIPRMKLPKNRQYTVRLMAPFNMRCATCGEYIYRGKKFNARKEDVEGDDYCGIRIYRFYIKCTRCLQEISFKTDPRNTDYEIEAGATRNFMTLKLAEEKEKKLEEEMKEEEATNPMTLLENRTKQSKTELERMEALEELKELNARNLKTDFNDLLSQYNTTEMRQKLKELQEKKDEEIVMSLLGKRKVQVVEEEVIIENESEKIECINDSSSNLAPSSSSSQKISLSMKESQPISDSDFKFKVPSELRPWASTKSDSVSSASGLPKIDLSKKETKTILDSDNKMKVPSKLGAWAAAKSNSVSSSPVPFASGLPKMDLSKKETKSILDFDNKVKVPSKLSAWAAVKSKKKKTDNGGVNKSRLN